MSFTEQFNISKRKLSILIAKQIEKNFNKYNQLKDFNLKRVITKEFVDELTGKDNTIHEITVFYQIFSVDIAQYIEENYNTIINNLDVSAFENDFRKILLTGFSKYYKNFCVKNNITEEENLKNKPKRFFKFFNEIVHLIFLKNINKKSTLSMLIYLKCFRVFINNAFTEEEKIKTILDNSQIAFSKLRRKREKVINSQRKQAEKPFTDNVNQYLTLMNK